MSKLLSLRIKFLWFFESTTVAPLRHVTVGSGVPDTSHGSAAASPSNTVTVSTVAEMVG